jgi:Ser/Thr protein kinase RdoA (MazF antagonist)
MKNQRLLTMQAPFNCLTPDLITDAIEEAFDISLESLIYPYPSYINRVYGLQDIQGREYVAKFYRPGRWSQEQILEEHQFLAELHRGECPVVLPIPDNEGATLQTLSLEACGTDKEDAVELSFYFALFPKQNGRAFDPESDDDWLRLGSLAGRIHVTGRKAHSAYRPHLNSALFKGYVQGLFQENLVPEDFISDFNALTGRALELFTLHSASLASIRLHGDFHRGNLISTDEQGLAIIDFDDMAEGPAVQDLWLLLPGHRRDSKRELELIIQGYTEFAEFNQKELELIEDLRFFRMIHYLHWQSQQRFDRAFYQHFPDWGSHAFWIKSIEDLEDQLLEMGG